MIPDSEPVESLYWPTTAQKSSDTQDAAKKFTLGFGAGAAPPADNKMAEFGRVGTRHY